MAQFAYTAVNQSGKKLSGIIGAQSLDQARKQLNTLGISVLNIQQNAESPAQTATKEPGTSKELGKFEFEAFDKTGKRVIGTIPASSRYKAFKRLMDEYQFEVSYVVAMGAGEAEKQQAKQEGLAVLKAEYDAQNKNSAQNEVSEQNQQFEKRRQALLKKVDYILAKIKELLTTYNAEIKAENKKIIQSYIDKLLRIKSSTNLDYIEHTAEELLKKVQDQELFLHKEKMAEASSKLKLETQQMLSELHTRPDTQKDISDDLEKIQNKLEGSQIKLFKGLSNYLERVLPSPEEKELKKTLHAVNRQVLTFWKLWLLAPKESKADAFQSLNKVREEKKRLTQEIKKNKKTPQVKKTTKEEKNKEPIILEEITHFLGWLLGLYIIAYFLSHYVSAKLVQSTLPGGFNLLSSGTLRALLISVFVWYALLSLRLRYFSEARWVTGLTLGLAVVLNSVLLLNL